MPRTTEVYPHIHTCRCGDCDVDEGTCDRNDAEGVNTHCFIRVMGCVYHSCMWCGRWIRLNPAGQQMVSD